MNVRFEPEAAAERRAAASWYEKQRPRLGLAFLEAIDVVVAQIVDAPHSFPAVHYAPRARRVVAHRFPYLVVYVVREDTIHVVAVADAKREPGYWIDRLDETQD